MRRILVLLVVLCALVGSQPAVGLGQKSRAPEAHLVAATSDETRTQKGKVIFSTWDGERFDDSHPPIHWPKALVASGSSQFSVQIPTDQQPFNAQVRAWRMLRRNGKPKGKPEISECGSATDEECSIYPVVTAAGLQWEIRFTLRRVSGPYYLAVTVAWSDAQVAWINHLKLTN